MQRINKQIMFYLLKLSTSTNYCSKEYWLKVKKKNIEHGKKRILRV